MNNQGQPQLSYTEETVLFQIKVGINSFSGLCQKLNVSKSDAKQYYTLDKMLQRLRKAGKIAHTRTGWEIVTK